MARRDDVPVPLRGLTLPDARGCAPLDLGALPGVWLLSLVRHRY